MIEIAFLEDHPETIPTLAHWFRTQWPAYYAERPPASVMNDFRREANRTGLPVRLVALADGELAGTITLRHQVIASMPDLHPGLGGLFVDERHRAQGLGTELVKAGMELARVQGYRRVYATTVAARGILERLAWKRVRTISLEDEDLLLYCCELGASGTPPNATESLTPHG